MSKKYLYIYIMILIVCLFQSCNKDNKEDTNISDLGLVQESNISYTDYLLEPFNLEISLERWQPEILLSTTLDKLCDVYTLDASSEQINENSFFYPGSHVVLPFGNLELIFEDGQSVFTGRENIIMESERMAKVPNAIGVSGDFIWGQWPSIQKGDSFDTIMDILRDCIQITRPPIRFEGYYDSTEYKTYCLVIYGQEYTYEFYSGTSGQPVYEVMYVRKSDDKFLYEQWLAPASRHSSELPQSLFRKTINDCSEDDLIHLLSVNRGDMWAFYSIDSRFQTDFTTFFGKFSSLQRTIYPYSPVDYMGVAFKSHLETWEDLNDTPAFLYIEKGTLLGASVYNTFDEYTKVFGSCISQHEDEDYYYEVYETEQLAILVGSNLYREDKAWIGCDVYVFLKDNLSSWII